MEHNTNAPPGQQLPLFDSGTTLVEISVAALTTEPELRDIGRALVTLTRYHDAKAVQP